MRIRSSQKGFSLPGVMIAASLMAFIGLAFSSMLHHAQKNVNFLEDKLSAIDLKNILTMELADGASCTNTLRGLRASGSHEVSNIRNTSNHVNFNSHYQYGTIRLNGVSLVDVNVNNRASATGRMNLNIALLRDRQGIELKNIEIPLQVTTDEMSNIVSCSVLSQGGSNPNDARDCPIAIPHEPRQASPRIPANHPRTPSGKIAEGTVAIGSNPTCNEIGFDAICINGKWSKYAFRYNECGGGDY